MDAATIIALVNAALGLAEQVIPLVSKGDSSAIGSVISKVEAIIPAATTLASSSYTAIKNIISNLSDHPATTADQLVTLKALDAQVDAAWDSVSQQFDPDYMPPDTAA